MNKPLYSRWHMLAAFALLLLSINLSAQAWQKSYLTTVGFTLQSQVFLTKTDANGNLNAPPNTCNGNLITNPSYENGLADWTPVGTVTTVPDSHTGAQAASLGGNGYGSIGMVFPTTPGKNYNFSVWAKSVGPFSYQAVTIRFLNSSYAAIPTLGTGNLSIGSSYTNATYQVTAPAGAVYVYALAYKDGPGGLLVDDWCLVEQGSTFLPDLVVSNIQVPSALNTGVPFNFSCVAKNNGLAPAPACNLHISLGSGLHIGNLPVPPLAVGQETTLSGQFDLPSGAGFGSGVVQAEIDLPDNAVQESNEINNVAVSSVVSLNNTVSCTGSVGTPICSNNGTPANPADDQFSFYINIGTSVSNPPFTAWTTTVNGQLVTGNFGTPALAGPFPISLGTQGFTVSGYQCTLPLSVNPPAPCSNASSNCPSNILQNPSFETGTLSGWTPSGGSTIAMAEIVNDAYSGSKALKVGDNVVSQQFSVTPGKQYTLRAWAKTSVLGSQNAYLVLMGFSGTGPVFSGLTYINNTSYQLYEVAFVAPANVTTAQARIVSNGANFFATMDDFCVTESTPTCTITASASNVLCNNNGTPNLANDDYFTFNFTAQKTGDCGTGWFLGSSPAPSNIFPYGSVQASGQQPIAGGSVMYGIHDATIQNISYTLTVQPPPTCSNGSGTGQIDLSLGLQQLTASPAQWSNYQVKATLSNAGPEAASGVKVKFAKPAGVVYVGGNESTASQGTFNPNGDEVWTVGSIPANGTATLTVNYFLLNNSAPVAYAQVMAQNETDGDSQPNNGTPPTPVQDDEASTAGGSPPTLQPDLTIADLQIPNSSVAAGAVLSYNFDASNIGTAAVPSNFTIKSYISTDQTLSANDVQDGTIQTGNFGIGHSSQNVVGASTIPASLAAGQYYLIVKIDGDDAIVEGNENNNMVVKPFTVTSGGSSDPSADLSLSMVMSSNTLTTSGTLNITAKLTNNGPDEATNIIVKTSFGNASNIFQFISVFALDGAYYPANGEWHVTALAAGSTYTLHLTVKAATPPFVSVANAYAKVEDVDQNDPDSTPGNDDPTEDDHVQESVTITNAGTPCDDVTITPATGQITIAGVVAPHHILKVFRPDWSIAFQCVDCATPQTITGLGPGSHFVEVKLINAGWSEICKETEYVGVTNIVGQQDPRQRISFDRVYPNPAKYTVNLEVYSPEDQSAVLDFYDQQGRVVYILNAELEEGTNNVQVFVFDWKSGAYNVIARGEKTGLPAYGRFLKVWEE